MDMPHINPVGLLEKPAETSESPRRFSFRLRLLAGIFVLLFLLVTLATTVTSLGRYCLTTDAADIRTLQHK